MTEFEKVISCFKKSRAHEIMPACYNPSALLNVYDMGNDYKPGFIIDMFKDPEKCDYIVIKIKYTDDTTRCYRFRVSFNIDLPVNTTTEYICESTGVDVFDCLFMTKDKFSKYRDKIWPLRFDTDDDEIYFEYVETIDPFHANYKFFWIDEFSRKFEYMITLSRDDINELLNDAENFRYIIQNTIDIMGLREPIDDEE